MALRSGLAASLGMKAETTYGTYAIPDHFYEFAEVGVALEQDEIRAASLRLNNRVLRSDRRINDRTGVGGDITLEHGSKQMGLWWKHALGAVAITTPGGATLTRRHTHTLGDTYGLSLTVQAGVPDTGGTVDVFSWLGCKIAGWELSQGVGEILTWRATLAGQDGSVAQALAAPSYATGIELFHFGQCVITVAGSALDVRQFSLAGDGGLALDRRFLRGSTLRKEPIPAALYGLTGSLEAEFESLTAYNRFVAKTVTSLVATWTSTTAIEGSFYPTLTVTLPAVIFTGESPAVAGPDIVTQPLPFEVLYNGTDEPITVTIDSVDTAS